MNICLLSRQYPPETLFGGIGTYTYNLAQALTGLGHQVHVIAQAINEERDYLDKKVYVHRIKVKPHLLQVKIKKIACHRFIRLPQQTYEALAYSWRAYQKLKEVIRIYKIDIIEARDWTAEIFWYTFFKRLPIVIRLHTTKFTAVELKKKSPSIDERFIMFMEKWVTVKANGLISPTIVHRDSIAKRYGIPLERVEIVPLGLDLTNSMYNYSKSYNRTKKDSNIILFVGRFSIRKGVDILIKAVPYVLNEFPKTKFILVGPDTNTGPKNSSFKKYLLRDVKSDIMKKLVFTGFLYGSELANMYNNCDIFVAPSRYEDFGVVYSESMAFGKPVIGCKVGGALEVIEDGVSGLLVPPENPRLLAEAIIKLLKLPELRRRMGEAGKERVKRYFTSQSMTINTLKVYKKVINSFRRKIFIRL